MIKNDDGIYFVVQCFSCVLGCRWSGRYAGSVTHRRQRQPVKYMNYNNSLGIKVSLQIVSKEARIPESSPIVKWLSLYTLNVASQVRSLVGEGVFCFLVRENILHGHFFAFS